MSRTLRMVFVMAGLCSATAAGAGGFNSNIERLPARFGGMDLAGVTRAAQSIAVLQKGEFETTADFGTRKERQRAKAFFGQMTLDDIFAFSLDPNSPKSNGEVTYDADAGVFLVKLGRRTFPGAGYLCPVENVSYPGSYIATNAFGTRVSVTRRKVNAVCIGRLAQEVLTVRVEPELARSMKKNLRVLLIGSLEDPVVSSEKDTTTPTITLPIEENAFATILHMRRPEIWVYDWSTGRILTRLPPPGEMAWNPSQNSALHKAIHDDDRAQIKRIIEDSPFLLNERNRFGATALHLAVWKNDRETVEALLAAGADKLIKDNDGQTPLDDARYKKFIEIVKILEK